MRVLHVAAFIVSRLCGNAGRTHKPFNPLLGETYEGHFPERGMRYLAESVGGMDRLSSGAQLFLRVQSSVRTISGQSGCGMASFAATRKSKPFASRLSSH